MDIIAFGREFRDGSWKLWEHICDEEETASVLDSARAKALDRLYFGTPNPKDFLAGVRYIFDIARGPENKPKDGDLRTYGVCVDGVLTGTYEELRRHFASAQQAA